MIESSEATTSTAKNVLIYIEGLVFAVLEKSFSNDAMFSFQVALSDFPGIYEKVMSRTFRISDYGVRRLYCCILKMLTVKEENI